MIRDVTFFLSGDFDVYALWMCFTFGFIFVRTFSSIVNASPLASVDDLRVWYIEACFFFGDAEGFPTAFLVVLLDSVPEAMGEIKLNSDVRPFMVCKIPLFFGGVYCCLKVPFRNVALSPSIYWYPFLEDFFCSWRRREVWFNVTRQWLVAWLDLSCPRVEFSACGKVLFSLFREALSHVGSMTV